MLFLTLGISSYFDDILSGGGLLLALLLSHDLQGTIGILDASTKEYSTVIRSHVAMVTCIDITTKHLISCSTDGTIRIWDMVTMNQVHKEL